ncbi:CAP domain-containing protein [Methylobacterium sp. WL9]|uniref:CAP domain-containing protein n=1 Tax=Methylobacterium sp. WL9 TaxID=2603898 RepID=UPI0011CAB225|nr:CAP domain-containing protein [Methylobacterium sp. WL9]TXN21314.1 CAP domain-containing protein [Methylobacterium sp. WL9]
MLRRFTRPIASLVVVLAGCSGAFAAKAPARRAVSDDRIAAAAISRYRAQYGLGPVQVDAALTRAAAYAARANAAAGSLSHDAGGSFQARMAMTGLARGLKAENLGAGTATFDQTLAMWQASSSHKANLLLPEARRIGIAHSDASGSSYGRFWALVVSQ